MIKDNWNFKGPSKRGVPTEWEMQALVDAMHREDDDARNRNDLRPQQGRQENVDAELASYEAMRRA